MLATTAVEAYCDHLEHTHASASTKRQRRWALSVALGDAAELLGVDPQRLGVADLLADTTVAAVCAAYPTPTARAICASLRRLAEHLGARVPAHPRAPAAVSPALPARATRDLAELVDLACRPSPLVARTQAIVALLGARRWARGQLVGLRRAQVTPTPHGPVTVTTPGGEITLDAHASARMATWCHLRDTLVARLDGGVPHALWVTVAPTARRDGAPYPAGLPLRTRGMERAHASVVRRVNQMLVAHPELRPGYLVGTHGSPVGFPTSLQALRRAGMSSRSGTVSAPG